MKTIQKQIIGTPRKRLSRLLIVQGIIMMIAIVLIVIVFLQAIPYKKKLDNEISSLAAKRDSLVSDIKNLEANKTALESAVSYLDPKPKERSGIKTAVEETPDTTRIIPRVYIHIWSNEQRDKAKEIAQELYQVGFIVPGIQRVSDRPVQISAVRYFRSQDKSEAARIDSLLSKMIGTPTKIVHINGYETKVQPRYFEIWFSPDALPIRNTSAF